MRSPRPLIMMCAGLLGMPLAHAAPPPNPEMKTQFVFVGNESMAPAARADLNQRLGEVYRRFHVAVFVVPRSAGEVPWETLVRKDSIPGVALLHSPTELGFTLSLNDAARRKLGERGMPRVQAELDALRERDPGVAGRKAAFIAASAILGVQTAEDIASIPVEAVGAAPAGRVAGQADTAARPAPAADAQQAQPPPPWWENFRRRAIPALRRRAKPIGTAAALVLSLAAAVLIFRKISASSAQRRHSAIPENPATPRLGGKVGGGHGAVLYFLERPEGPASISGKAVESKP